MSSLISCLVLHAFWSQIDRLKVLVAIDLVHALGIWVRFSASILLHEVHFVLRQPFLDFLLSSKEAVQILLSGLGLDLSNRACFRALGQLRLALFLLVDHRVGQVFLVVLICLVETLVQMTENARLVFITRISLGHALVFVTVIVLFICRHVSSWVTWVYSIRNLHALAILIDLGSVDVLGTERVSKLLTFRRRRWALVLTA